MNPNNQNDQNNTSSNAPAGVVFDAPTSQATTVGVPAGVSFDAPTNQATTVTVGQPANQPSQPSQSSTPSQPTPAWKPTDSFSAVPDNGVADEISNWANSVANDLRHGTSVTGFGALLHKMGANPNGLEGGVSPQTADFIGSLPLGLLKAIRGGAEVTQSGQRLRGAGDVVGGALQASTVPGSFVAPEAAELAGGAVDAAAGQAARAARPVVKVLSKPLSTSSVQPTLQQGVRSVLAKVASDAGVTPSPSASIRDVAEQVGDAILARSSGLFKQLDAATGGDVSRFEQAAKNVNQRLREVTGLDDEAESALVQRKAEINTAQQAAFDKAKAAGVDPALLERARADWKQGQALHDLDSQIKMSANGVRPEMATPQSTPETVDPKKAFTRLNRLYDSGRLQQAVGQQQSEQLIQHADTAFLHQQKIVARQQALKTVGKVTGTGAAIGVVGAAAKAAKDALGNE